MPYRKKHDYELYKRELEEQLYAILDWDDYDPEHYGWGRFPHKAHPPGQYGARQGVSHGFHPTRQGALENLDNCTAVNLK